MCDSVVVTGAWTATGATLFAKNSDRARGEAQPFLQFPAAFHPRGSGLQCTHLEIPQVAETYRVMGHSPWWVWGFEHGVNEHGVAIGNHTVFSREPVEERPGLIGMDLVRLGLERGRDAREALEVIAALLETHGQGGPALAPDGPGYHNSFSIADPQSAWLMETSNRRWAARRVERGALTNRLTLDHGWHIGSRDLDAFARAEGWWPSEARLDVGAAYRSLQVPDRLTAGRHRRALEAVTGVGPGGLDWEGLRALLRDHGEGPLPPVDATPEDERFFSLCMHSEPVGTTAASLVAPLPADRSAPWPVWAGFGPPCLGVLLPVYLDALIPACLARGGPQDESDSAWWAFERLHRAAERDFAATLPVIRESWSVFEEKIEHERASVEQEARRAAAAGDGNAASYSLGEFVARIAAEAMERAESLRARLVS